MKKISRLIFQEVRREKGKIGRRVKPRKLGENSGGGGPRSPRKKRRIG